MSLCSICEARCPWTLTLPLYQPRLCYKHSLIAFQSTVTTTTAKYATMSSLITWKSLEKKVADESNVFYTYKLKRNNKKINKHFMTSDQYQKASAKRVVVISPLKRKKSKKSANPPLPPLNCQSSNPSRLTDNARRQQCLRVSLLELYMNSDSFKVDTSHDHMPVRVNPERIYRHMESSFRKAMMINPQTTKGCTELQCASP